MAFRSRSTLSRTRAPLALSLACLALNACAPALPVCDPMEVIYLRADLSAEAALPADSGSEIDATPRYDALRPRLHTLAILASSGCTDDAETDAETIAETIADEDTEGGQNPLHPECARYLLELEDAFTRAGYRVVTHAMLAGYETPAVEAATRLGAQVLFRVHRLETPITPLRDARDVTIDYYHSNARGDALRPPQFTFLHYRAWDARVMRRIAPELQKTANAEVLTASLDLRALTLPDEEPLWSYRRSLSELASDGVAPDLRRRFLFATAHNETWSVLPEDVDAQNVAQTHAPAAAPPPRSAHPPKNSDSSQLVGSPPGPRSSAASPPTPETPPEPPPLPPRERRQLAMVQTLVDDAVQHFGTRAEPTSEETPGDQPPPEAPEVPGD